MPARGKPLRKLGFLTIGRFDQADPATRNEQTLAMIERAEALGFDSVWLRHRHLQPGISSPVAMLAAASPAHFRAEITSADCHASKSNPETHELENLSKDRVARLLECLRGDSGERLRGHRRHRGVLPPGAAALTRAGRPRSTSTAPTPRAAANGPRHRRVRAGCSSPRLRRNFDELADALYAHAGFQRADEVAFALPFTFDDQDYLQIVTDLAEKLGPRLGWTPSGGGGEIRSGS